MREDLYRRFETHRRIASWTHGLIGRSPDNFPSYVSGLVMDPAMFERIRQGFGVKHPAATTAICARTILFVSHTVTNPQGWRPTAVGGPPPTAYIANLACCR